MAKKTFKENDPLKTTGIKLYLEKYKTTVIIKILDVTEDGRVSMDIRAEEGLFEKIPEKEIHKEISKVFNAALREAIDADTKKI